jgi:2-polyprenyl-3-methyl-5-hydroxy-6-metoxy-1,4-benzoquinol methylase
MGPSELGLQQCLGCGIVFLRTDDAEAYVEQVQEEFFTEMERGQFQRLLDTANARAILRRIRKYKPVGRLLEIGIGNGNFIRAAQRAGYDCMGVEASPGLARSFGRESSIPVFVGYLNEFATNRPSERFDVVVMNHVLEHISDPLAALQQIRGLLTSGGIAHIAVPNLDAWEARLTGWTCYEPYHLYYFAPATLSALAQKAGLGLLRMTTKEGFSGWTNALARTLLQRKYKAMRVSHAGNSTPSAKQRAAKLTLDVARITMGTATLPLRLLQSRWQRGEELISILGAQ